MKVLEHKVPPPLVTLICASAMWYLASHTPVFGLPKAIALVLAIGIGITGVAVAVAGALSFRQLKTTINPMRPETATALATSGIYRYTRNPMYLGMLLLLVGWAVYLTSPAAFIGVLIFWFYIGRFQIHPEERALAELFGESYSAYASRVRRWL